MFGLNNNKIQMQNQTKILIFNLAENIAGAFSLVEGFCRDVKNAPGSTGYPEGQLKSLKIICGDLRNNIQKIFDSMSQELKNSNQNSELEIIREELIKIQGMEYSDMNKNELAQNLWNNWTKIRIQKNKLVEMISRN